MKNCIRVICFFLISTSAAFGQDRALVDSLSQILTTSVGADRYAPLYELAFEYLDRDNQKALDIMEEAQEAALLSGDSMWIVKSMRVKAQLLSRLERLAESIECGEKARRIAINNGYSNEQAMVTNSLAACYALRLRLDKAFEYLFNVLHLARAASDSSLISSALHNIGVVHLGLDNYSTSLDYFLKAQKFSKRQLFELRNMSISYAGQNDFENAEYYLSEGMRECGSTCSEGSDETGFHSWTDFLLEERLSIGDPAISGGL